jgi:hypothetical protein
MSVTKPKSRRRQVYYFFSHTRVLNSVPHIMLCKHYYASHAPSSLCLCYLSFPFLFVVLGLEVRTYTLSHSTSPFLCVCEEFVNDMVL